MKIFLKTIFLLIAATFILTFDCKKALSDSEVFSELDGTITKVLCFGPCHSLQQYPAAIRAQITRMIVNGKISVENLKKVDFSDPNNPVFEGRKFYNYDEPAYKKFFDGEPHTVITLGNKTDKKYQSELLFVTYPVSKDVCKTTNKQLGLAPEIIKLTHPLNLTPNNIPVPSEDIVILPSENEWICYQGTDGIFYYIGSLGKF